MGRQERTPAGEAATELILSTFRANGLLLDAGDLLSADEGLTSSRWQVLGAIVLAERPLTVPQIARRMGLTRQSVHASVDRLVRDGLLEHRHVTHGLVRVEVFGRRERRTDAFLGAAHHHAPERDPSVRARTLSSIAQDSGPLVRPGDRSLDRMGRLFQLGDCTGGDARQGGFEKKQALENCPT